METREVIFNKAEKENSRGFDFIIVGGGATGLGCALDSVSRGFKTILIEEGDFSQGTSCKSTKLIHGGVRYLAQGNIALVREALRERSMLFENAPHIVEDLELLIPNYSSWEGPFYSIGLAFYDILAGGRGLGKSKWVSKNESIGRIRNLQSDGLRSGILYHDGKFDDSRLAIALTRTIFDMGGLALNYLKFTDFIKKKSGRVKGIRCKDLISGETKEIYGKVIVNATGSNSEFMQCADDEKIELNIRKSQGSHIVVDSRFLGKDTALLIPKTPDGRVLFAIPWLKKVIIGTTDVPVDKTVDHPVPGTDEIHFILETASQYLESSPHPDDIRSVFAGIRPLVIKDKRIRSNTKKISREHHISIAQSSLLSISGGKWTTYRKMAEDVVDTAIKLFDLAESESQTKTLKLHGHSLESQKSLPTHFKSYGSDQKEIIKLMNEDNILKSKIHPSLEYLNVEVIWACRNEMAVKLTDILARRTRSLFLDAQAAMEAAPSVVKLMRREFGKDESWEQKELEDCRQFGKDFLYSNP